MHKSALIGFTLVACSAILIGCDSSAAKPTAEQAKDFKGGPMPPDARKKFEESMAAARTRTQQAAANGRAAATGGGAPGSGGAPAGGNGP